MNRGKQWSPAENAKLAALWAEGFSPVIIANCMGKTRNSILGMAHRMNLPRRREPSLLRKRYKPKRLPKIVNEPSNKVAQVVQEPERKFASTRPWTPGMVHGPYQSIKTNPEQPSAGISLFDAGPSQCRMPIGEIEALVCCGDKNGRRLKLV